MRKSEAGSRRVSFAADAAVRVYSQWHGTPSPARASPPNRAIFPSEEDYNAMSPLQKKLIENSNRRSGATSTPPRRSMSLRPSLDGHSRSPSANPVPKPGPQSTSVEDEDVDMDIDDEAQFLEEPSQSSDMSVVTSAPSGLQSQRPSISGLEGEDDADMSIVDDSMEIRNVMSAPRKSHIIPQTPRLSTQSDMSVAATEYDTQQHSIAQDDITDHSLAPPLAEQEENRVGHEFVVPLGHRVPRTDTEGNVLSPTQAEKDKAAALAALAAFGGENDDDEDEGEGEDHAPVVPVRGRSEMSVEDANRHTQNPSRDLAPEDTTSSTMSLGDTTGALAPAEATVNITTFRQSLLHPPPPSPVRPAATVRPSAIPVPKSPARASKDAGMLSIFTPATPSGPQSLPKSGGAITRPSPGPPITKSPAKAKPSFTAAFAPPSVSPRKRALSVPSPASIPNKRRAISAEPSSPSKARSAVITNAFSKTSFRPTSKAAQPKPMSQPVAVKRNPFLDQPDSLNASSRPSELPSISESSSTSSAHTSTNKENVLGDSLPDSSRPPRSSTADILPTHSQAGERVDPGAIRTASNLPPTRPAAPTTQNPIARQTSRPSITPFSNAPLRKGSRLSAAFRTRRSSVAPGNPRRSSIVPDPAVQMDELNVPSIVVSQEQPPETTEVQLQLQPHSSPIDDQGVSQTKSSVTPMEPTAAVPGASRSPSPGPSITPEPTSSAAVQTLRSDGPRVVRVCFLCLLPRHL